MGRAGVVCLALLVGHCGQPPARLAAADGVLVVKHDRTLSLLRRGTIIKTYRVALGGHPTGQKIQQGDERTPEGAYSLDWRSSRSQFHRAIHISYPNPSDVSRAKRLGVDPGGDIMIHGLPPAWAWSGRLHRAWDWTDGCIAVTNQELDEIWAAVPDGTTIDIRP
jgi:murein L,D-transpeptidase YafK